MTLEQIVKQKLGEGLSLIEIQKYLRDQNMIVSFVEMRIVYNRILSGGKTNG